MVAQSTLADSSIAAFEAIEIQVNAVQGKASLSFYMRFRDEVVPRIINRFCTTEIDYLSQRVIQTDDVLNPERHSSELHPREAVVLSASSGSSVNVEGPIERGLTVYIPNNDWPIVPKATDIVKIDGIEHNIASLRAVPASGIVCLWVLSVETSR